VSGLPLMRLPAGWRFQRRCVIAGLVFDALLSQEFNCLGEFILVNSPGAEYFLAIGCEYMEYSLSIAPHSGGIAKMSPHDVTDLRMKPFLRSAESARRAC